MAVAVAERVVERVQPVGRCTHCSHLRRHCFAVGAVAERFETAPFAGSFAAAEIVATAEIAGTAAVEASAAVEIVAAETGAVAEIVAVETGAAVVDSVESAGIAGIVGSGPQTVAASAAGVQMTVAAGMLAVVERRLVVAAKMQVAAVQGGLQAYARRCLLQISHVRHRARAERKNDFGIARFRCQNRPVAVPLLRAVAAFARQLDCSLIPTISFRNSYTHHLQALPGAAQKAVVLAEQIAAEGGA